MDGRLARPLTHHHGFKTPTLGALVSAGEHRSGVPGPTAVPVVSPTAAPVPAPVPAPAPKAAPPKKESAPEPAKPAPAAEPDMADEAIADFLSGIKVDDE